MPAAEPFEHRAQPRLRLQPMYSSVTVQRVQGLTLQSIDGHAYDISLSGVRLELDEPMAVGERLAICLRLPGEPHSIFASGRVVWTHDTNDDPGARRLALQFTRFLSDTDRERLVRYLGTEPQRMAA